MENLVYEKKTATYDKLIKIENLRKKLSSDTREYHYRIMVKQIIEGEYWAYITNGSYMLKTRIDNVPEGVFKVIKEKSQITLIHTPECSYPKVEEVENNCKNYSELEVFTASNDEDENISHALCQIIRAMPESEHLNYNLFSNVFKFSDFGYFMLCKDEEVHRPHTGRLPLMVGD